MTGQWLAVIDMQRVFADPSSAWFTPRFGEIVTPIGRLVDALRPRVTFTRFVAPEVPTRAWRDYYRDWPFALVPSDNEIYQLVDELRHEGGSTVDSTTFGKWTPELAERAAGHTLVLAGVATDCCVLSTALAAADTGVRVRVVADACAGVDDAAHDRALEVIRGYRPLIEVVTMDAVLADV
jgi:nicotinamidase-related amidase